MPKTSKKIPPVKVGTSAITYTPPGEDFLIGERVFKCRLMHLRVEDEEVDEIPGEVPTAFKLRIRADLLAPDGTWYRDVPLRNSAGQTKDTGSWCRPYITSIRAIWR